MGKINIPSPIQKLDSSVCIVKHCMMFVLSNWQVLDNYFYKQVAQSIINYAAFIDKICDWPSAKHWAMCDHLKILLRSFSTMEVKIQKRYHTTTKC